MDIATTVQRHDQEIVLEKALQDLRAQGWCNLSHYFSRDLYLELRGEALDLFNADEFRRAGIGPTDEERIRSDIRRDFIHWFDPAQLTSTQAKLSLAISELMESLSRRLFFSLQSFEAHYAVYPKGGFYKKHVDQFQADCLRQLSLVVYLNEEWRADDGGQLRIYKEGHPEQVEIDIVPQIGTAVLFLSSSIYHEVLPTSRQRVSVAGWMRKEVFVP